MGPTSVLVIHVLILACDRRNERLIVRLTGQGWALNWRLLQSSYHLFSIAKVRLRTSRICWRWWAENNLHCVSRRLLSSRTVSTSRHQIVRSPSSLQMSVINEVVRKFYRGSPPQTLVGMKSGKLMSPRNCWEQHPATQMLEACLAWRRITWYPERPAYPIFSAWVEPKSRRLWHYLPNRILIAVPSGLFIQIH